MKMTSSETGRRGEVFAEKYLQSIGFKIIDKNWRWRKCEIDLIAIHNGTVVFLEVKTRGSRALDEGVEIKPGQRKRIVAAASAYLATKVTGDMECRFDLVRVRLSQRGWRLDHIQDVFEGASI
jgi:putative endonuclease